MARRDGFRRWAPTRRPRRRSEDRARQPGPVRWIPSQRKHRDEHSVAQSRSAHRHRDRSKPPDRQAAPGGRQRRGARERADDDHGLRGLGRRRRRGRQNRRVSQLVRHHARHAAGGVHEGRRDRAAQPESRPRVHRAERRAARATGPQPPARAARRLAHDDRRRYRRGRAAYA